MQRCKEPPLRFVLITTAILLVVAVVSAVFALRAVPLAVTIGLLYIAYFIYGVRTKDHTIWIWLVFGFVTGLVQVGSNCDVFLVEEKAVLVYPTDFPRIGVSPAYLPMAWGLIFTVLGLAGEWIRQRRSLSLPVASIMTAAYGGVLIAMFENLARPAGWWYYKDTPILISAPYFVNVFEFLSAVIIVPLGWAITRESIKYAYLSAIICGIVMGIWMCVAMRIGYWLLGPCSGAVIQMPCSPVSAVLWH